MPDLNGMKVAVLVADGFEQVELTDPCDALRDAGAEPLVVSPAEGKVKGWKFTEWGDEIDVDVPLEEASADDFGALLLPGGVMNPDKLRKNPDALRFVRDIFAAGKPVAVICHGPWTMIDAGVVRGRRMTSYSSVETDLRNAGADWVDQEVVVDHGLVSSRNPKDLPAFIDKMLEEFEESLRGEGIHPPGPGAGEARV